MSVAECGDGIQNGVGVVRTNGEKVMQWVVMGVQRKGKV